MKRKIVLGSLIILLLPLISSGEEEGSHEPICYEQDGRTITIRMATPEEIPAPAEPHSAVCSSAPAFVPMNNVETIQFIALSCTVFQNGTHLSWVDKETGQKLSAWSKINWAHFEINTIVPINAEEQLSLFILAASIDTVNEEMPVIPAGEDFVLLGNSGSFASVSFIEVAHQHYEGNRDAIVAAYHIRCLEQEARRSEALANPPQPEDVTILFWKAEPDENGGAE